MNRKQRDDRRERIRQIEQAEAKARCAYCKAPLPKKGVQLLWNDPRMFCSPECVKAATEATK